MVCLLGVGLLWLLIWLSNQPALNPNCAETGDYAAIGLRVEEAKGGTLLVGPYSRFRFSHPGPALSYIYALFEDLVPGAQQPYGAHSAIQLALNLLLLLAATLGIARASRKPYLAIAFLILTLIYFSFRDPLVLASTWGPHAVTIPILVAAIAAATALQGWPVGILLFIVAAGIAFHTHLGTLLPLAFIGLSLTISKRTIPTPPWVRTAAALLMALLAAPIIIDLLIDPSKSNLWRTLRYFLRPHPAHPLPESISVIGQFYADAVALPYPRMALLLSALSLLLARLNTTPLLRPLRIYVWGSLLIGIFSVRSIAGPIYPYLVNYTHAFVVLTIFILCASLLSAIAQRIAEYRCNLALVACFIAFVLAIPSTITIPANSLCTDEPFEIMRQLNLQPGQVYEIVHGTQRERAACWDKGVALALALTRADAPFCVKKSWGFMYGHARACSRLPASLKDTARTILTVHCRRNWSGPIPDKAIVTTETIVEVTQPSSADQRDG